jgi:hypothetical protein
MPPMTLPTAGMGWDAFEALVDDLLVRLRLVPGANPALVTSSRYGKAGQDQAGIDLLGSYDDGSTATWQCKEQLTLTEANVTKIISDTEVAATRHVIVFSRVADAKASSAAASQEGWSIWDQRDLGNLVRTLPLHEARTLLDAHFGTQVRRQFLPVAGTDVFLGVEEFYRPLLRTDRRFHHNTPLVGRNADVAALVDALTDVAGPSVVLLDAPAGRGKSRLVLEVLRQIQNKQPLIPVLVRAEQRPLDSGALQELPDGPTLLLVEDAHRDPTGFAAVVQYARRTEGVRVLLTSRPSGAAPVTEAVLAAQFDLSELLSRTLAPLTASAARELITSLLREDLTLPGPFSEALAQAARATPLIAVVAIEMIRRGELSTALTLDSRFRNDVMLRYGQVTTDGIPGLPADRVKSTLALIAALTPVDLDNADLIEAMAQFEGIAQAELLTAFKQLVDHGVLLQRGRHLRVVPDVLADEVLTGQAVQLDTDTGYVDRVWAAFGMTQAATVLRNLAELDWRIRSLAVESGAASVVDVFGRLWLDVRGEVLAADNAGRTAALGQLGTVAGSQSDRVFSLVADLLAAPASPDEVTSAWNYHTHHDVRRAAAPVLRTCATANPHLLPSVLDALWELAIYDKRPPNQDSDHPVRIIEDTGNLGNPGSLNTAAAVLAAVTRWLSVPDPPGSVRTPLFALAPLVAKEGITHHWEHHAVQMSPHLISADKVRPVRDQVRDLLRQVAAGDDVRRAVEAIRLLGDALREPHGYFNQQVPQTEVLSWEPDDLATVEVLDDVASSTGEPVIRLAIRNAVDWHAVRASSPQVQVRCLALVESLDNHVEDVLTDLLRGHGWSRLAPRSRRRDFAADPTVGQITPGGAGRAEANAAGISTDPTRDGDEFEAASQDLVGENDMSEEFEQGQERRRRERTLVARQLWAAGGPPNVVQTLIERLTILGNSSGTDDSAPGTGMVLAAIVAEQPGQIVGLLQAIEAAGPGPLDSWVAVLLGELASHDAPAFLDALGGLLQARTGLATGALSGFRTHSWVSMVPGASDLLAAALDHPDEDVELYALAAAGSLLQTDMARYAPRLAKAAPDQPTAICSALETASGDDPAQWVPTLRDDERTALLTVIAALPEWDNYLVQHLAAAIAVHLPERVLQLLTDRAGSNDARVPYEVDGLAAAVSTHPDLLTAWVRSASQAPEERRSELERVWLLVAGEPLSVGAVSAVRSIAAQGTADELDFLTGALANGGGFALRHVDLVVDLVSALTPLPKDLRMRGLARLRMSAQYRSHVRTPGKPADVTVQGRDAARALSESPDLPQAVRDLYATVADNYQKGIDDDLQRDADEDE